jgi:hypothetical protein
VVVGGLRLELFDHAVEEGLELGGALDARQNEVPGDESGDGGIARRRGLCLGGAWTRGMLRVAAAGGDLLSVAIGGLLSLSGWQGGSSGRLRDAGGQLVFCCD